MFLLLLQCGFVWLFAGYWSENLGARLDGSASVPAWVSVATVAFLVGVVIVEVVLFARRRLPGDQYCAGMHMAAEINVDRRADLSRALAGARWLGAAGLAVVALALAACSNAEDIGLINDSEEVVVVEFGDGESEELPAGGGTVILDVKECYAGPVVVSYEGGRTVELPGPICPADELRITAGDAVLSSAE